jgi:hypothetical protein
MTLKKTGREPNRQRRILQPSPSPARAETLEGRFLLSGSVLFGIPLATPLSASGSEVAATVVGDLNGDGIPDVIASRQNLQAQVYLGTASGALTSGQIVATGATPIALGAFTASKKLDLATADGILPGNGDGTFGAPIGNVPVPINAVALYAQDVNGDGNVDLIAATSSSGVAGQTTIGLAVMLGNGDGTFRGAVSMTVGSAPNIGSGYATFQFGDFRNNNKIDILTPFGLMLGNGDGTFTRPTALPFTSPGSQSPPLPAAPDLAIGDFNDDGILDVVAVPANGATGEVEIFLGNEKGGFADNGPVSIGTGNTITSLAANDLGTTGSSDLLVGLTTPGGESQVAVLTKLGTAAFGPPVFYSVTGSAVSLTVGNFNNDGIPDLLTLNEAVGAPATTSTPLIDSASVLLGAQQAANRPVIVLHSSVNPVVDGNAINFTATLSAPAGSGLPVPTGSVTFFNGTTSLGTVPLSAGSAIFSTVATGVGLEPITVQYTGDTSYTPTTSAALSQIVLATSADVPLLIPSVGAVTLPTEFLPRDHGNIPVTITNGGNGAANGRVSVSLFLSTTGAIDSSAIALNVRALDNRPIHLARGRSTTVTAHLVAGSYPAGFYFIVAQLAPVATFTADEVSETPVASATTFQAAGQVFGTVGKHRNLILKVSDSVGHTATLSIAGPGTGTVAENNGLEDITITGTASNSRVLINSRTDFSFDTLTITGDVNSILARKSDSMGGISVSGGVRSLTLAGIGAASVSSVPLTLGGGSPSTLSLGNVGLVTLTSIAPINTLTASTWLGDAIDAPSIRSLNVKGSFAADIRIHAGGALKSATLGGVTGGTWAIPGGIGTLHITGALSNTNIFAGADTGPDDVLNTADDVFVPANIGSIFVGGAVTSSLVVAGGTFPAGSTPILAGLGLLGDARIGSITARGAVSADSRFLAARLPLFANFDRLLVKTSNDPRFVV